MMEFLFWANFPFKKYLRHWRKLIHTFLLTISVDSNLRSSLKILTEMNVPVEKPL